MYHVHSIKACDKASKVYDLCLKLDEFVPVLYQIGGLITKCEIMYGWWSMGRVFQFMPIKVYLEWVVCKIGGGWQGWHV